MVNKVTKPKRLWEVDQDALRKARQELGIRFAVKIKSHYQKHTDGTYSGLYPVKPFHKRSKEHRITIGTDLCHQQAGITLWHELTHAAQRERYRNNALWSEAYEDAMEDATGHRHLPKGDSRYKKSVFETEARQNERRNGRLPLCYRRKDV